MPAPYSPLVAQKRPALNCLSWEGFFFIVFKSLLLIPKWGRRNPPYPFSSSVTDLVYKFLNVEKLKEKIDIDRHSCTKFLTNDYRCVSIHTLKKLVECKSIKYKSQTARVNE